MRQQNVLSRSKKYAHLHHVSFSGHKDVRGATRIKLTVIHVLIVAGVRLTLPIKPAWRNR